MTSDYSHIVNFEAFSSPCSRDLIPPHAAETSSRRRKNKANILTKNDCIPATRSKHQQPHCSPITPFSRPPITPHTTRVSRTYPSNPPRHTTTRSEIRMPQTLPRHPPQPRRPRRPRRQLIPELLEPVVAVPVRVRKVVVAKVDEEAVEALKVAELAVPGRMESLFGPARRVSTPEKIFRLKVVHLQSDDGSQ